MRKTLSAWGIILLMLVLIVGTVGAQSGDDPNATPTTVPTSEPAEPTLYTHPIVQILGAYFGRTTRPMLPTPTPTETPTVDPSAPPTEEPSETPTEVPTPLPPLGPDDFAEQIAMYHDQGIGFGVLVKLYAMAEDSVQACLDQPVPTEPVDPAEPACVPLTVDELVGEFQGGAGMGQLFKEYGKPALLGVGHVKKALRDQPDEPEVTPTPEPSLESGNPQDLLQNGKSNNGNGNNGNKPVKVKTPKPPKSQGPKK